MYSRREGRVGEEFALKHRVDWDALLAKSGEDRSFPGIGDGFGEGMLMDGLQRIGFGPKSVGMGVLSKIGGSDASFRCSPLSTPIPHPIAFSAGPPRKKEVPWKKTLVGGAVTVVFEALAGGHALEFAKIAKQTSHDSYGTIFRRMVEHKGISGVLDGFFPWGALQALTKGAAFSFGQSAAMSVLDKNKVLSDRATTILSGGIGGAIQGIFLSPALLLKTRVMTDPVFRRPMGVWETTVASSRVGGEVLRREGVLALWKGAGVFATKRFFDWGTRYAFVELVEGVVRGESGEKLGTLTKMLCALAGGTLSALSTIPLDVLVASVQKASEAGKQTPLIQTIKSELLGGNAQEILAKNTRGLVARVAHVALTTMLMKQISSAVYDKVFR